MPHRLKHTNRAVGAKQVGRALRKGETQLVFFAQDADPKVTDPLLVLCEQANIPFVWVPDMQTLGNACGISVGSAVAAVIS